MIIHSECAKFIVVFKFLRGCRSERMYTLLWDCTEHIYLIYFETKMQGIYIKNMIIKIPIYTLFFFQHGYCDK